MSKTVDELLKAGIAAKDYARGPIGKDNFTIAVEQVDPQGVVRVWEGAATIETHIDSRFKQAVLNVQEVPRKVTRKLSHLFHRDKPSQTEIERRLFNKFPVAVPNPVYSLADVEIEKISEKKYLDHVTRYSVTAKVTATAQSSTLMTFLTGFDEKYHFVSALPKKVGSVEEAHEVLRGDVPLETIRQGEWFFVPVLDETLADELTQTAIELLKVGTGFMGQTSFTHGRMLEDPNSSHCASDLLHYMGELFAIGIIYDRRKRHHAPLILNGWHKVVRNREITAPMSEALNQKRMQRWD